MSKVVGIDLGTTNSLVAYVKDGVPVVIRDRGGDALLPSVVSVAEDQTVYVGREAERRLLTDSGRTVYSVKRFMGKGVHDVGEEARLFPFRLAGDPGGIVKIGLGAREFTAPMYHQGYIEPHAATALWNKDGHLTVWNSTQASFPDRATLASTLRMPVSRITVSPAPRCVNHGPSWTTPPQVFPCPSVSSTDSIARAREHASAPRKHAAPVKADRSRPAAVARAVSDALSEALRRLVPLPLGQPAGTVGLLDLVPGAREVREVIVLDVVELGGPEPVQQLGPGVAAWGAVVVGLDPQQ